MIEYHPICAKDHARLHQVGKKVFPGIFVGYALHAEIWKGDILSADVEDLKNLDASERDTTRRKFSLQRTEINSYSRAQMEQLSWQDQIKKSEHPSQLGIFPIKGEDHHDDSQGKAHGSNPAKQQSADYIEARDDF